MSEWLKVAISKVAVGVTLPGVRIPLSPYINVTFESEVNKRSVVLMYFFE